MNYSNTIIYKIVCRDVSIKECYVGQTTNVIKRKYYHKSICNNINSKNYNIYIYQFIRENGNWDNWDIIEIEKYEAVDKLDAGKRERYWIETLQATLNKVIPTRTHKEYYEENKDKTTQYLKEYYEENKVKLKEHRKEYIEKNKEQIKENSKEYYELNKEQIKEYKKEWYKDNKDKIKEYKQEKITCSCGTICNKSSLERHERTKKHIEFLKTI